jgi:hypothetical protein
LVVAKDLHHLPAILKQNESQVLQQPVATNRTKRLVAELIWLLIELGLEQKRIDQNRKAASTIQGCAFEVLLEWL